MTFRIHNRIGIFLEIAVSVRSSRMVGDSWIVPQKMEGPGYGLRYGLQSIHMSDQQVSLFLHPRIAVGACASGKKEFCIVWLYG